MNHKIIFPAVLLALTGWLQGCVAVVATGAATGAAVAHDQRSAGAFVDDQSIELKALGALNGDKAIYDQTHTNITSYNGIVLITGEAPTEQLRSRIGDIVSKLAKVRRVHNEVVIAAPSSFTARSSDTLLTGKVKTKLLTTRGFDATRVKIVTEGGTVYLMGLVTRAEADIASDAARQAGGVQRVVKIFEYTN